MANKQIVNFNASTTKPLEGQGVKGTLYFITGEQKSYLCTDSSTFVPMDGSVKNVVMDVSTKQLNVSMIGDTSINTEFITSEDVMGTDMVAREELIERVDDITKILTGSGDIPYFNKDLDYYKGDFVIYQGRCYKFIYDHPAGVWNGNDVEITSLMAAYKELLELVKTYTGVEELPEFSDTQSYAKDDIVTHNKALWRFTEAHAPGSWNGTDVEETSLIREYFRLANSTVSEVLQVHVTKQDTITTKTDYADCSLNLTVDSSTSTIVTDENGDASALIEHGKVYSISCPNLEGYSMPGAITRTSQINSYFVNFNYLKNTLVPDVTLYEKPYYSIFSTDFSETPPEDWATVGYNKEPIGAILNLPALQKYGLKFLIRFKDIVRYNESNGAYEKHIETMAWQSGYGQLNADYVPTTQNATVACNDIRWEGVTENIIEKSIDQFGQYSPAAEYAYNQELIINGVRYGRGRLGSGFQTVMMLQNEGLISQCVNAVYGITISFTNNSPRIWTNVQYNASFAWNTNGSSLGYGNNSYKTNSVGVVPFFAVPSPS